MSTQGVNISPTSELPSQAHNGRDKRVIPISYQLAGLFLNVIARLNTEWAANKLAGMWFTVFKRRPKNWVHSFWNSADFNVEIHLTDKCIPVYVWGEGPLVVLVHGWNGSGTQYRNFIPQLVAAGFKVAVFDAPAHGNHPGRHSHLLDFSDALVGIQKQLGPVTAVIAHSLGSMASVLATHRGLNIKQMVMLAPHLDAQTMFETYAQWLNLDSRLEAGFRNRIGQRMKDILKIDDAWDLLHTKALLDGQDIDGMLVCDSADAEVPAHHFEEVESLWNPSRVVRTSGLGHFRLFKDKAVINQVVEYLQQCD